MSAGRGAGTTDGTRALHPALLLAGILVTSWVALVPATGEVPLAPIWPASGLAAGLLVLTAPRLRAANAAGVLAVLVVAHLLVGTAPAVALGASAVCAAEALVVHRVLTVRSRRPALLEDGDVSRLVAACSAGSALAAAGYAALVAAVGGDPAYAALVVLGTHAASLLVLLPLFLATPNFPAVAGTAERVVRGVLLLGATVLVFAFAEAPPVLFAIMPIFAWLAFRGTLRESTLLLAAVAVVATAFTVAGTGPVWALEPRYGLAPEVALALLQLFVVDCALVLLPVAVAVAQQRVASAHAVAGRTTLERLVAAATGTAIFATDTEGRIVLFNPGAEATFGYNLYEVVGQTPDRFYPPEELARQAARVGTGPTFVEICAGVVESEDHRRLWRFRRQGGDERTMLMTLNRVLDEHGRPSGFLATGEDVTERERAQAALMAAVETQREALARLEELDRTKSAFVSTVSHELRTPLTSIVGYTELLGDGAVGELSAEQRDLIGRVDRNGRRLLLLIEDLLTYSRLESGALRMERVQTDLRQAVAGAYEALTASLHRRDLDVDVDLPRGEVAVLGDPVLLERAVLNLLTNAVKFTPDGGSITTLLTCDDLTAVLVVRDSGVGIPSDEVDQLFTRFFRSSTATSRAIQGTGLGLSIVQGIVEQHGGEVSLRSDEGRGTTVTVTLPTARAAREHADPAAGGSDDEADADTDDDDAALAVPAPRE